jgi:15-cis-phytoene synthase
MERRTPGTGSGVNRDLLASYDACRRVHLRHDPTYYFATRRLPQPVRPAVHALYAFVRGADEIVDGPRRPRDPAARRAALDRWEHELERALAGEGSDNPAVSALVDAGTRHDLPLGELRLYMASMRADCGRVRIGSWAELERYMQGSAGAVGRILAPLLGAPADERDAFARLGLAFQLTNFIRDVRDDWRLDRIYLPADDRERFGVGEEEIARRAPTAGFRALLALEVGRARALFRDTESVAAAVAPEVRRGMRVARTVYLRVLDRVEQLGFDVLRRRASLRPWELAGAAASSLRRPA